ncbi:VOC family protein [Staphylospora marina]|uniref:VOC family protein n=1 Tax=Staphylospora marina TaxID=2490858 RepID=UPI000F5BB3AF|nr:VOC family protein [Staphylospora marina]
MFHHAGIAVRDPERSVRFYREALGFREAGRWTLGGETIVFLERDDVRLELVSPADRPPSDSFHLAFATADVEGDAKRLVRAGAVLREGPRALENGWILAFLQGPDGEWIELLCTER